ncbi:MAG: amidophosphoribosyltransferase [Lysobacterales bacterium]
MCGLIGLVGHEDIAPTLFEGLTVLQHRGQDAAGIATCDGNKMFRHKGNGLANDVFSNADMSRLRGTCGIGHVRYPTAGGDASEESQPLYVNSPFGIALGHNGNLTNAQSLKRELFEADRRHINTDSDSEVLLNVLAHELRPEVALSLSPENLFAAVKGLHRRCRGGYAFLALIPGYGLLGVRDPWGIRPLVFGKRETELGTEYAMASESVALDVLGFEMLGDVQPGEALFISAEGECSRQQCADEVHCTPCIFELVYFARPDSMMDDISVYKARLRMGERLAKKILTQMPDHDIDVVIPVPDTSRTAAIPLAHQLGVKYREGFIKNRYIGRTFIMPGQQQRARSVRRKLNVVDLEFRGKTVLIIDDSIVRGTTSKQIIQMARDAGAKKVYFASAAPPVRFPNVYGIDMPAAEELIAHGRSEEEIEKELGADWLIYQSLDDLVSACSEGNPRIVRFDTSCFSNEYVTGVSDEYFRQIEVERSDSAKHARAQAS